MIFSRDREVAIGELASVVKINRSTPWGVFEIFIREAVNGWLVPYLGRELVDRLSGDVVDGDCVELLGMVREAVGAYAVALGADEMGISTGDGGHMVAKGDKFAPASDAKVARAKESLYGRAWAVMERILVYLEGRGDLFPEWRDTRYHRHRRTCFFSDAESFQDGGLLDIGYSRLVFERLRTLIVSVEEGEVMPMLGGACDAVAGAVDERSAEILACVRMYVASRVGELYTSVRGREERMLGGGVEFVGVLRPAFAEVDGGSGNYYAERAALWRGRLMGLVGEYLGVVVSGGVGFDNEGKRIFFAG